MFIYLHGLNSSGQSNKAAWLRPKVKPRKFYAPSYPAHDAGQAIPLLKQEIQDIIKSNPGDNRIVLIGSSLGGYYAIYLSNLFQVSIVLINPALLPKRELLNYTGTQINHTTGEEYELTKEHIETLEHYRSELPEPIPKILLLMDKQDEVIDYRHALNLLQDKADILLFPGGSHAFEHLEESLPKIISLHDEYPL